MVLKAKHEISGVKEKPRKHGYGVLPAYQYRILPYAVRICRLSNWKKKDSNTVGILTGSCRYTGNPTTPLPKKHIRPPAAWHPFTPRTLASVTGAHRRRPLVCHCSGATCCFWWVFFLHLLVPFSLLPQWLHPPFIRPLNFFLLHSDQRWLVVVVHPIKQSFNWELELGHNGSNFWKWSSTTRCCSCDLWRWKFYRIAFFKNCHIAVSLHRVSDTYPSIRAS